MENKSKNEWIAPICVGAKATIPYDARTLTVAEPQPRECLCAFSFYCDKKENTGGL